MAEAAAVAGVRQVAGAAAVAVAVAGAGAVAVAVAVAVAGSCWRWGNRLSKEGGGVGERMTKNPNPRPTK